VLRMGPYICFPTIRTKTRVWSKKKGTLPRFCYSMQICYIFLRGPNIMKQKSILSSVTFLATLASVLSASCCITFMAVQYNSARTKFDVLNREFQGWQACRQTKPAYYEANKEALSDCVISLDEARRNFWIRLPKVHLLGLFVLSGLGSAIGGYLATWIVVWFGLLSILSIYRFIKWLALCFRGNPRGQVNTAFNGPRELTPKSTPKLTPTRYSECKELAKLGNERCNSQENGENSLQAGENQLQNPPPDLAKVASVWPELPEHLRQSIKALVGISKTTQRQE